MIHMDRGKVVDGGFEEVVSVEYQSKNGMTERDFLGMQVTEIKSLRRL
ncbi:hypothetical protein [Rhodoferax sp. TH121]|nr:hypothetical protein [Rhodoferax sp. TH121]